MVLPVDGFDALKVVGEVRCVDVVLPNAHQVLPPPCFLVVDFDLPDCLKPAPFPQHRDRQPELALLVLQPVTSEPASSPGKLNVVQQNEVVCVRGLVEEPGPWQKDGLVCYNDHAAPSVYSIRIAILEVSGFLLKIQPKSNLAEHP